MVIIGGRHLVTCSLLMCITEHAAAATAHHGCSNYGMLRLRCKTITAFKRFMKTILVVNVLQ
jgi:hypothetical protein